MADSFSRGEGCLLLGEIAFGLAAVHQDDMSAAPPEVNGSIAPRAAVLNQNFGSRPFGDEGEVGGVGLPAAQAAVVDRLNAALAAVCVCLYFM